MKEATYLLSEEDTELWSLLSQSQDNRFLAFLCRESVAEVG